MDKILDIKIDVQKRQEDPKQNKENVNTMKNGDEHRKYHNNHKKRSRSPVKNTITLEENYHQTTKYNKGSINLLTGVIKSEDKNSLSQINKELKTYQIQCTNTEINPVSPVQSSLEANNKMKPESIKLEQ